MENKTEIIKDKKKIGAGIIIISVLYLIGQTFTIIGCIINFFAKDLINETYRELGIVNEITTVQILITLVISLIITIAVILILFKKSIGAFLFIGTEVLSFIYNIIVSGIGLGVIALLIFPFIMMFFIYNKKDIYFRKV